MSHARPDRLPRDWRDLTSPELTGLAARDPVAVLPLAAIEQHGPHLPVSTDLDIAEGILTRAVGELPEDLPLVLLPPQAVGASAEHAAFAGTVSLDPLTLEAALADMAEGLARHGIRRWVLFSTHGGNKHVVDAAALRARIDHGMLAVKAHSFRFPVPEGVDLPEAEWRHGLHGGAVETAMMLHLRPDLVREEHIERFPSLGEELEESLDVLLPEGRASFAWRSEDLNPDGVTGDARLATPELGRRLVDGYGRFLSAVLKDAARFPLERLRSGS